MKNLLTFMFLGFCSNVLGATYTAASCNQSAVLAAITSEQATPADGDIISIPAGTCTWSGSSTLTATFSHSVTIQGAGAVSATTGGASTAGSDNTIIIDNTSPTGSMIAFVTTSGKSFRLTGVAFETNSSSSAKAVGMVNLSGTSSAVRIDHNHMILNGTESVGFYIGGIITGVADHDYLEMTTPISSNSNDFAIHNGIGWNGDSGPYADGSWTDTEHWGSSEFFFLEDDRWHNGDIADGHDGARYVLRYSTVVQDSANYGQFFNHGLDDRARGARAAEIYQNTFTQPGTTGVNHPTYSLNSGSLLYWGNTITQYLIAVEIDYTRKDSSTYTYPSPPSGWGYCNTTSGTVWDGSTGPGGYPCLDQAGRGSGELLNGQNFPSVLNTSSGTEAWPVEALSPAYIWNNSLTPAGGYSGPSLLLVNTTLYSDNHDYYQQFGTYGESGSFNGTAGVGQGLLSARPSTCTAGPGGNTPGVGYWATDSNTLYVCNPTNTWTAYYTPYTYPNPLTSGSGSGQPGPPTNILVTVH